MERRKGLLGYYDYTVILTYTGMLVGFLGIVCAFEGNSFRAVLCLMLAGFCDMFDGAIASTKARTRQEKCFGIQIDSLSDLIGFGALPALLVYSQSRGNTIVLVICGLYLLCALIRLAYFNVDEQERQQRSDGPREINYGMPVTMSALFLPVACSAARLFSWDGAAVPVAVLLVTAVLFVLPFPVHKPRLAGKIGLLLCGVAEVAFVLFAYGVL